MSMKCFDARQLLKIHLQEGGAPDSGSESHLHGCDLCQQWHFNELLKLEFSDGDVPEPDEGMINELINRAIVRGDRQRISRFSIAAGIAIVALALGLFVTDPIFRSQAAPDYEISMIPQSSEMVEFVINSTSDREIATVTIELAENLELSGFPDNKIVSWETPLAKGKNLLRLPVLLKDEHDGEFNIGLSYGSTTRELTIMVKADQSVPPKAALSVTARRYS